MLTRLKIDGFKNLDGVDVRFGSFTCVAGPNGVGKSNLFDAIAFLAALAERPLAEAAALVRGSEGRVGDVRALFGQRAKGAAEEMSFLVEMVVPPEGVDELGAPAKASMTFLRYELALRLRAEGSALGPLELVREQMTHINKTNAQEVLCFPNKPAWRDSVILGRRTVPYIETDLDKGLVQLRADSVGGGGGPRTLKASTMPRTILSTATNAAEHRTLVLARQEMKGWTQFQLEPTALRAPDPFFAPRRVGHDGAHLPAALIGLAAEADRRAAGSGVDVYLQVANRLAELFEDVRSIAVDTDHRRELYSILLKDRQGCQHPASSLSDGTLRFLALAILEASELGPSLLCLEEPENGIHPDRIGPMIRLLRDIAVDVNETVGPGNPLRQVIINTHSPGVVQAVPEESLLLAEAVERAENGVRSRPLSLRGVPGTWRTQEDVQGSLLPVLSYLQSPTPSERPPARPSERRLADRADLRQMGLFSSAHVEDL